MGQWKRDHCLLTTLPSIIQCFSFHCSSACWSSLLPSWWSVTFTSPHFSTRRARTHMHTARHSFCPCRRRLCPARTCCRLQALIILHSHLLSLCRLLRAAAACLRPSPYLLRPSLHPHHTCAPSTSRRGHAWHFAGVMSSGGAWLGRRTVNGL